MFSMIPCCTDSRPVQDLARKKGQTPFVRSTRRAGSRQKGSDTYCPLIDIPRTGWCTLLLLAATLVWPQAARAQSLPMADPSQAGLDAETLATIPELVRDAIAAGDLPGCVVCVGRHGKIVYLQAIGDKQTDPDVQPMEVDTVFDLASLTKPVATATSIMILIDQGKLKLDDHVADYFPAFGVRGKEKITVNDLLIHQSGLTPDNALGDYLQGEQIAWEKICDLPLIAPVGTEFKYSDVNFIVLGKLVEKISGSTLDSFVAENIFVPLGMTETGFNPAASLRDRAAPTEQRDGHWMRGEVHDPRAFALDGVAGHAGLFSTANDLAIYAQMMLEEGQYGAGDYAAPQHVLSAATVELMTAPHPVSSGIRGLGWDKQTGFSSNKGERLTPSAFGHGGFTGTAMWIDPELDLFVIFLSNRLHPDGVGSVNRLAGRIADTVVAAIQVAPAPSVRLGVDVLRDSGFDVLDGSKVGLITNHTGRDSQGRSTVELLNDAENVELKVLFSPEHGFAGALDVSHIGDSKDSATGLKIYSLYGETRRPTAEMLAEIDTVVFDIQDIGCRFYTYVSTMGEAMRAAAEHGKRFVVLDRPNPIGGVAVAGPMLDAGKESFVGYHSLPVRHGMTTGELATMFRDELGLELDLHVVKASGWERDQLWDATNLMWVNPSPNMRSLTQALLYPGIGLLEMTNLSVGRGTDTPFEVIGAPWIRPRELAAKLNAHGLPGVRFIPIEFTPTSSKFENELCGGVNIVITDWATFEPLSTGLLVAHHLRGSYPEAWETKNYNRLLGNDQVFSAVVNGESFAEIMRTSQSELEEFLQRRLRYLMY
jgi:uncharacterized protein YbbC (DUF1343 family)/CubicO group peptidase (beta-lactamase class C family)